MKAKILFPLRFQTKNVVLHTVVRFQIVFARVSCEIHTL